MGQAVAERTILRKDIEGKWENWGDVACRVALGNSMLATTPEHRATEYELLRKHISNATLLMSGRSLQHGDATQPDRTQEIFTNCATAATSFATFLNLMSGAGVGRCYDDDMMLINWDNAPQLRCVLSDAHPNFNYSAHESSRDAKHKYGTGKDTTWFVVPDTREGWAKAVEIWEVMAFEKIHKGNMLILDFSDIRQAGQPIKGMQNRPASGPVPLMNAFNKAASVIGAGLAPWLQTLYIDHYLAECVLVGGARRSARMATKWWKDNTIYDFINIKRPIEFSDLNTNDVIEFRQTSLETPQSFLWSANNSVMVDSEFWRRVAISPKDVEFNDKWSQHARKVFLLISNASYGDGTGEPGFINVDKIVQNNTGLDAKHLALGNYVGSARYRVNEDTPVYMAKLAKKAGQKKYSQIVNPCGEISLHILGGFCVIADVVPFHADTIDEAEEAFRVATRALIRLNTMPSLYSTEVKRTNRIGVGMTGVHEFAWKFFRLGFRDLIDEIKAKDFWDTLARFHRAVREEADTYSAKLNLVKPHTVTCCKPSGCMVPETRIKTSEGVRSLKGIFEKNGIPIGDLENKAWFEVSETIEVFDKNNEKQKITRLYCNGKTPTLTITMMDDMEITLTENHKFLVEGKGWVEAKDLTIADDVVTYSPRLWAQSTPIKKIERNDTPTLTVDIEVEDTHSYQLENGCVVHNSVSKLFALTEGWHLPSMEYYLRWVQFADTDPLIKKYEALGYPIRKLTRYQNVVIVGFPTAPTISNLGMGDKLVCAGDTKPEELYQWLMLGEKYWIQGVDEKGDLLLPDRGNQISFTLRLNPAEVSVNRFRKILKKYQSNVRCCALMPYEDNISYEYQPEEKISRERYDKLRANIKQNGLSEDIALEHIACESGACPIDFKEDIK